MSSPLDSLLTRRQMLKAGACLVSAYWFLPLTKPGKVWARSRVQPRGSARFVIFVMLQGGQSHVDGWDLKEHAWTPEDFDVQEIEPGLKWPMSLYPKLARHWGRFSLVRSLKAWDAVHARAAYYIQSGHTLNPALQKEIPPIGAVVAYEYAARRRETDTLPGYVATNTTTSQVGLLKSGFLPATYSPFHIDTTVGMDAFQMEDKERSEFLRRWELLKRFDARLREDKSLENKAFRDYHNYYEGAVDMMADSRAARIFAIPEADHKRYGETHLGDGCIVARNLVTADAGTHFMFVSHADWDHHGRIYSPKNHYQMSYELDDALSALLSDLAERKRPDGTSLLDETMVICMGEFGRTPGEINGLDGRDHHQYAYTGLFAGGGVQGGQVIGQTDDLGFNVVDGGWQNKRPIYMEDVTATIYSALGIDWTKAIEETPSGRTFSYIEPFAAKAMINTSEISPLFS